VTLAEAKDVATLVGIAIGAGSLLFAALNLLVGTRTNRAKFWLELRSAFAKHDDVHRNLRPGGTWANDAGPDTPEEYAQVEAYMGLFEHCEIMLSQRLIDEVTFREIYRYRLENLVANTWVREEKLCRRSAGWKRFIALLGRMEVKYECPKRHDA
jgi:hypothetical protein